MPQIPEFRDEPFEFEYMVGVQLEKEVSALRSKQETGKFDGEDIRALEDKLAYVKRLDEFGKNRMADSRNTMRAYPRVERFEEGVDYFFDKSIEFDRVVDIIRKLSTAE